MSLSASDMCCLHESLFRYSLNERQHFDSVGQFVHTKYLKELEERTYLIDLSFRQRSIVKPSSPDLIYKIPNEELVKRALESLKLVDIYMRTKKDSDELDKALEILSNSIN